MGAVKPVQIVPEIVVPPSGSQGGYYTAVSTEAVGAINDSQPIAALVIGNGPEGVQGAFSVGFSGIDRHNPTGSVNQQEYCAGVGMKSGVASSNTFRALLEGMCSFVPLPATTDVSDTSTIQQSTHVNLLFGTTESIFVQFYRNNYTPQVPPQDPLPVPNFMIIAFYGDGVRV